MKKIAAFGLAVLSSASLVSCGTTSSLKDGTFTQHQTYSPAEGYEFYIDVTTALEGGKIASINVEPDPNGQATIAFATEFKKGLQEKMVGKTLDEAKEMGYVSGASLTSNAFKQAIDAIKTQATAQ